MFCGEFLGVRDSWAKRPGYSALKKKELLGLLTDFKVLKFSENENDSGTLTGNPKHWHVYSVIARKR